MGPPVPSVMGATGGIMAFPYTEKGIPWEKGKEESQDALMNATAWPAG